MLSENNNTSVTIFEPVKGKHLVDAYPQLADVEEFSELGKEELDFVWYYSNKTSPFYLEPNRIKKISSSFIAAFGSSTKNKKLHDTYLTEAWPAKVSMAMSIMRQYNPDLRSRAYSMVWKIFENHEKINAYYTNLINSSPEDENGIPQLLLGGDDVKKYIDITVTIRKEIPLLVSSIETELGVKEKKDNGSNAGSSKTIFKDAMESVQNEEGNKWEDF